MDLNYPNVHADKEHEYSLFYTFTNKERCYLSITQKTTRITERVEIYKEDNTWFYGKYPLEPAMQIVAEYYYNQWKHEENCEFLGFETEKLKKRRALANVKDVISQEFELDKQFQTNSFSGW